MGALEQIADSRRQKIVAAQESETRRFAGKIADEIIGKTGLADRDNELKETISGLASAIGEAVVASGEQYQLAIGDHFSQLIETLSVEPDLTSLETLADRIDAGLRELKQELARLELKPEINLEAPDYKPLLSRLDSLVAKIPNRIEASIDVDYRPAPATDYLNVRLTDGKEFYKALGGRSAPIATELIAGTHYDYLDVQETDADTETYVFKLGGASGSIIRTIVVNYTDSTKETTDNAEITMGKVDLL